MVFHYYTNTILRASRSFAGWMLTAGLFLTGIGVLILVLPELFAILAAGLFFIVGFGCLVTAGRIFLSHRRFKQFNADSSEDLRKNVRIHGEGNFFD